MEKLGKYKYFLTDKSALSGAMEKCHSFLNMDM